MILQSEKPLICFGAGKIFDKFVELFDIYNISERIRYIVENDASKVGIKTIRGGRQVPVISSEEFKRLTDIAGNIFLITLKNKDEIVRQYPDISFEWASSLIREYCTSCFDSVEQDVPIKRLKQMEIPKVIHYCWFGGKEMPEENKRWMASWEKYCPGYQIKRWDESNYDIEKNQYMREAYKRRRWGFASDYARLDIIYENGGIYLDTDVELVKSLDELLYQKAFMGWEDGLRVATGLGFGAVKGMDILREMRDAYEDILFVDEQGRENLTACPTFQTDVLLRHGLKRDGEYQIIDDIAILPVTYLCGKASYVTHPTRTEHTFAVHQFQGSWRFTD